MMINCSCEQQKFNLHINATNGFDFIILIYISKCDENDVITIIEFMCAFNCGRGGYGHFAMKFMDIQNN